MRNNKCRFCDSKKLKQLLFLENFPKAAQFFLPNIKTKVKAESVSLEVVQCLCCSLIQLTNKPVSYYKSVITAASLSEKSKTKLTNEWSSIINKFKIRKKNMLEVGSGRGDFLEVMNSIGFQSYGLEFSAKNIEISKKKNLKVFKGYLTDKIKILSNKYELVVCNNFLEHQPNIKNFVDKFHDLLSDNGYLYISVPNFDYLKEKACFYEFVADHLVYFNKKSLENIFSISGFEILDLGYKNNKNDIYLVAKKRKPIDIQPELTLNNKIVKSLNLFLVKNKKKSISVWGAGHRAMALLSLAKANTLEYVIDSADFKQNKFMPIIHTKIVPPEHFKNNQTDILIIMLPGAYADQVKDFVKMYSKGTKVYLFEDSIHLKQI
jgi:2-polyprenyl-3-methyl-5-hydroxy-6-metoxy-1,4-benzoquinol methylase